MRKINPEQFDGYIIKANGWSMTVFNLAKAKKIFDELDCRAQFLGNRKDGQKVILDEK